MARHCATPGVRSSTRRSSSAGSPKRRCGSTAWWPPRRPGPTGSWCCASRSGSACWSPRGTSRPRWPPARSGRRWRPAVRWCSSRPRRHRCARSWSQTSCARPGCRTAWSTWCAPAAPGRWCRPCWPTRGCASCRSPVPPKWAGSCCAPRRRRSPTVRWSWANAPFLIFEDADLDAAIEGAFLAKMRNGGEACTAANRFYVHEKVAGEFTARFSARLEQLSVGPGLDEGTDLGPLVNEDTRSKVASLVADAAGSGSHVVTGGKAPDRRGFFYLPTVLADVPPGAGILNNEIFGPVAPVVTFTDEADAIRWANDTEYGLVSYLYTADLRRALRVTEAL